MGQGRRSHGRWFDLAATVLIGLVVTGAALVPAATANSGETITIRGDVEVGGDRLPFFPVGFWVPDTGVVTTGRTDANGVFTLDVPITLDGYAYAGTTPDSDTAITASDGRLVVRGTIGAKAATPVVSPLYQGWDTATGRALAGGAKQLHFALQEAGRVGGTLPLPRSQVRAVQVRRLDGSVVQTPSVDGRGRWVSEPLVPGQYAVALVPRSPLLPVAVQVTVQADETVRAALPAPVTGAVVNGRVASDPGTDLSDLPVLLEQDDRIVARTTTDDSGGYRFTGLAAGDYSVEVGRYEASQDAADAAPVQVPIPGRTASSTPTPTATGATPTPSPQPSSRVLEPVEQVADAVRPSTTPVTVSEGLGEVAVTSDAVAAGRIGGVVSGADGSAVQVVVEDSSTGQVLRTVDTDAQGRYSVGGLQQGEQYTVWAVTRPSDPTQARMGSTDGLATAATRGVDVVIDRAAASLRGTVSGAAGGSVAVGDASLLTRSGAIDASGAYAVQGLVPGLFPAVVRVSGRLDSDRVAVGVTEAGQPQDLQRGPEAAEYQGWFISAGDGVPIVSGTATSGSGDVVEFGPRADDGIVRKTGLRPGTYTYDEDSFTGTVPALDGPWWFDAPQGAFVLNDGAKTDVGPVVLHVRAR